MNSDHSNHAVKQLDAGSFAEAIREGIVAVDFGEPWSGPCRVQMAILENLASHVGPNVMIAEMNIDDARDLAVSLHIENIPTLLLFKDGQLRGRFFGVQPEARLARAIEAARVG